MGQECANMTKERKAALYFDDIDALGAENTHHLQASSTGGHLNMPAYHPCDSPWVALQWLRSVIVIIDAIFRH